MADSGRASPFLLRADARAKALEPPGGDDTDEAVASGDAYATITGQRVASAIEFIPRHDDSFVIPYGYLPLLWPKRSNALLIEYPTLFTVALQGKGTDWLKRLIRDQRVMWIRECSEAEAALLPVAITRIAILRAYPSRDAGIDPAGSAS
jgi:hypothetical protein